MARQSTARKTSAKSPAKAPAKKTSARRTVKSTAARATPAPRVVVPDEARIIIKTKENPRRPGTVQYDRYQAILDKGGNKTVAAFLETGGKHADRTAVRYAASQDHIELRT